MLDAVLIELGARGVRTAVSRGAGVEPRGARAVRVEGFRGDWTTLAVLPRPVEDALVLRRILEVAEGDEERSAGTFADR